MAMKNRQQAGFGLQELMITLAIVSILAAIAYPSYLDVVRKGRRADAQNALLEIAARQEQFFLDNSQYASALTQLGYADDPIPSPEGYYNISILAATATCPITSCFVLEADPVPGSDQDQDNTCDPISLNSIGNRTPTECW